MSEEEIKEAESLLDDKVFYSKGNSLRLDDWFSLKEIKLLIRYAEYNGWVEE